VRGQLACRVVVLPGFRQFGQLGVFFGYTEQVKRFELLPQEWTVETGEMTPKLSLRRKVVTEKFHDTIEKIYMNT